MAHAMTEAHFREVYDEALARANAAAKAIEAKTHWFPCGFAWVNIRPATSSFARWLKKNKIGSRDNYYGGWTIWCHYGNTQSMTIKEVWAHEFAKALTEHGITAHSHSRID
jgi:hypothetical protein